MRFKDKKTINIILESLFDTYSDRVPDVKKITSALIESNIISNQSEIVNDHIAFRTMGVEFLGIQSLEKKITKNIEPKEENNVVNLEIEKKQPRIFEEHAEK